MGRKNKTTILSVFFTDILVGELKKQTNGSITFKYGKEWLDSGFAISNSLLLEESEFKGEEVNRYFDNLLPDNEGIKKLVAQKYACDTTEAFDMLQAIGKDCVGALSFLGKGQFPKTKFEMNYSEISEKEIANRLKGLGSLSPLGMKDGDFRISIAGAQEKTAFLQIDGKWHEPHGLTPTSHIFKTPIGAMGVDLNFEDSVDNEWASLYLMKKMGLDVCETEIKKFEDQRVLVVKRFDRKWIENEGKSVLLRIPQEDMCQALGYSPYQKYQSDGGPGIVEINNFLKASSEIEDRFKFFKSIMIFDLLYAIDGHAKNFSIFLKGNGFQMTPIYDVMSGYFLSKSGNLPIQKLKMAMSLGNSGHYQFKRIQKRHYEESAKNCGISKEIFEKIYYQVKEGFENLTISDNELDSSLNKETLEIILEGMKIRAKKIL